MKVKIDYELFSWRMEVALLSLCDCPLLSIKLHVMKLKGYFEKVHQLTGDTENITESIVHSNALKGMQLFPKLLMQILTNYFHKIYIYIALFLFICFIFQTSLLYCN